VGHRQDVRFHGGFQAVDPFAPLDAHDALQEPAGVDHRRHLLVGVNVLTDVRQDRLGRRLADGRDARAHRVQRAYELALVDGEGGFDEEHVHQRAIAEAARRVYRST
jgi:hypothetical protein